MGKRTAGRGGGKQRGQEDEVRVTEGVTAKTNLGVRGKEGKGEWKERERWIIEAGPNKTQEIRVGRGRRLGEMEGRREMARERERESD